MKKHPWKKSYKKIEPPVKISTEDEKRIKEMRKKLQNEQWGETVEGGHVGWSKTMAFDYNLTRRLDHATGKVV